MPDIFDVDNYLITAKDLRGLLENRFIFILPVLASMFHDDDGSSEWETRTEYEKPGPICIAEYDPVQKKVVGMPKAGEAETWLYSHLTAGITTI